jgi:hypothetical protein
MYVHRTKGQHIKKYIYKSDEGRGADAVQDLSEDEKVFVDGQPL